jgi:medium-chain acyl-[acyl-carrier-protein] hydrolase
VEANRLKSSELSSPSAAVDRPWFSEFSFDAEPDAVSLFAFPYAGGGTAVFRSFTPYLGKNVRLRPIHIPGREMRIKHPPFSSLSALSKFLVGKLKEYFVPPFAFYGHSMGAGIAFEVTQELRRQGHPLPCHLFCSARRAPQIADRFPPLHVLDREDFLTALSRYEGTPSALFENRELQEIFLPILRSDFALGETYLYTKEEPLPLSITTFAGRNDAVVPPEDVAAWGDLTSEGGGHHIYEEGHFFSQVCIKDIARIISSSL